MRARTVAGNWKMNTDLAGAIKLFSSIYEGAVKKAQLDKVLVCPPFPFLSDLKRLPVKDFIHLGSQNVASEASGAFTGEVSASMIRSLGIPYTLIGHSERRVIFGEGDALLRKKVDIAQANQLRIVFCCGEGEAERKKSVHEKVVREQLQNSLFHLDAASFSAVTIAYEPVWAIGTGLTATAAEAQAMHKFIRSLLAEKYGKAIAETTSILYGGSCNSSNAGELFACEDVDGGLIGGASLNAGEFLKIIGIVNG